MGQLLMLKDTNYFIYLGKTTTMAALIELLTRMKKRVLVTSFTHSAIDNILINLVCLLVISL